MNIIHYFYLCASLGFNPNRRIIPANFEAFTKGFLVPKTSPHGSILEHLNQVGIITVKTQPVDQVEVEFTQKGIDIFKKAHNRFANGMSEISNNDLQETTTVKVKGQVLIGHAMAFLLGENISFSLHTIIGIGRKQTAILTIDKNPDTLFMKAFRQSFGEKK
jgi:hypothetical protein